MSKDELIAEIKSYATDPQKQETLSDLMETYDVFRLADLSREQCEEYLEYLKKKEEI